MRTTKTILILSANPKDTARLRLDEEVREIGEGLKLSKNREQFIIHQAWAVRLRDLRRVMLEYEPQIVHFCGHGQEDGLMVEDKNGNAVPVGPNTLAGLFELFKNSVECVLFNACYSQAQAEAINKHVGYVIGMRSGIQDKTAIEFAVGFYDALGAGKSIEEAFKFGCNAIELYGLPDSLIPVLKTKAVRYNENKEFESMESKASQKKIETPLKPKNEEATHNKLAEIKHQEIAKPSYLSKKCTLIFAGLFVVVLSLYSWLLFFRRPYIYIQIAEKYGNSFVFVAYGGLGLLLLILLGFLIKSRLIKTSYQFGSITILSIITLGLFSWQFLELRKNLHSTAKIGEITRIEKELQILSSGLHKLYSTPDIQIVSLEQISDQIGIHGNASSNSVLSDYLKKLEDSKYFYDVQLEFSKKITDRPSYREFKILVKLQKALHGNESITTEKAKKLVTDSTKIPNLLDEINESIVNMGLTISQFRPLMTSQKKVYCELPVHVEISGENHQFISFSRFISEMETIINLKDIKMISQTEDDSMYKFSFNTVVFSSVSTCADSLTFRDRIESALKIFTSQIDKTITKLERNQQNLKEWFYELFANTEIQLTSIEQNDKQIFIHGKAFSNPVISDYIQSLQESAYFTEVELLFSKQTREALFVREFEISMKLQEVCYEDMIAERLLTDSRKIPNVLDQINTTIVDAGLNINRFQPSGQSQKEFYREIPVNVELVGEFDNFIELVRKLENMKHLVTLRNIKIVPQSVEKYSISKFSFNVVVFLGYEDS